VYTSSEKELIWVPDKEADKIRRGGEG